MITKMLHHLFLLRYMLELRLNVKKLLHLNLMEHFNYWNIVNKLLI
jgi:hypothetical protein